MLAGDEESAVMLLSGQSVKTALYAVSLSAKVHFPVTTSNIINLFEFQRSPKFFQHESTSLFVNANPDFSAHILWSNCPVT